MLRKRSHKNRANHWLTPGVNSTSKCGMRSSEWGMDGVTPHSKFRTPHFPRLPTTDSRRPPTMSRLTEVSHPLIKHHLSRLRDKHTPPAEFRQLVQRLAVLL